MVQEKFQDKKKDVSGKGEKEETVQRNFKKRKSAGKSFMRKRKKASGFGINGKM